MKKLGTPCVLFCSAAVKAAQNSDSKPESTHVRRTDLPVYADETQLKTKETEENNSAIMDVVKSFRVEACKASQAVKSVTDRCSKFLDTGVAHSYSSYINATEFLRDDKNQLPRIGAVAGGVLVGYVFSFRRGYFKRLLYPIIGGIGVAAVCYPKEASEYYDSSLQLSRRYSLIGYHFLNGVSKDFIGVELPPLPQKIQEPVAKDDKQPSK